MRRPAPRRRRRGAQQQLADVRIGLRRGTASRWLATTSASAGPAISARAASRCRRSHSVRVRSSPIAAATRPWAKRSPSASSRPAASSASRAGPSCGERDAGDGGDHVRRRAVADDRQRRGDRAVAGAQRGQPPAHDVAGDRGDGRGVVAGLGDRVGAVRGDLAAELAQQPRVAADGAMAVAAHDRRRVRRQAADQLRRAAGGQPLRVQHGRRAHAAEQAQQVRRGARVVGARADRDQQRQVVDPPREVGEHLQRGAVGPLRVVDDERQRSPVGDRRAQPQHAVGEQHRRVAAGDGALEQQRARRRGGPVEQLRALLAGGLAQRRLQQRAHDPEGEVALERARRGAAHEAAAVGGEQRRALEQRRLAQARGRLEHDDPALAVGQPADRAREHPELDRALDQRRVVRASSRAAMRRRGDGTPRCDSRHGSCSCRRARARNLPDRWTKTRRTPSP